MINKRLILETSIDDFITNDQPRSNNIATWIMQLYELEFKYNTARFYPHLFSNDTEELKRELTKIIGVISKQFATFIYFIYQSWYNYHDYFNSGQQMIHRFYVNATMRETKSDSYFLNMVKNLGRLTQKTGEYTYKQDTMQLYNFCKNNIDRLRILQDFQVMVSIHEAKEYTANFVNRIRQLVAYDMPTLSGKTSTYIPSFQFDLFINAIEENHDITITQKTQQYKILQEYIFSLIKANSAVMRDNLGYGRFMQDPQSTLAFMEDQIKEQYILLSQIDTISQHTLLTKSNILLHKVHYSGSMMDYLEELWRTGFFTSEFTLLYPYDITPIANDTVIRNIFTRQLYFNQTEQIKPSLTRIQNLFQNKESQKNFIRSQYASVSGSRVSQFSFLQFLSNLPKPELRQWGKELNSHGLDKHFHMLMQL